jgi:DNA mismatch repair protein MutS
MSTAPQLTPAMQQHARFKQSHPDCLLLFRMGDFYELFYDDAKTAHKVLGVTLTQRSEGVPMAGVPYHAIDGYLRRLVAAGYRVAVCEQMEDPALAKGVVKREVTRVVTPGTLTDESLLDEATTNPLAAVMFLDDTRAAVAFAEISTGAFHVAEFSAATLADELARISPKELLYVETATKVPPPRVKLVADALHCALTSRPAWQFRAAEAHQALLRQYRVTTLAGFGIDEESPVVGPAGALLVYLLETQQSRDGRLEHLQPPRHFHAADHLVIDQSSLRSLEIDRTLRTGEASGSLLATLQDCRTAMGKRMLRQWLCYPLKDIAAIQQRQGCVAAVADDPQFSADLKSALENVQDVQRISARLAIGRPTPRDLVGLGRSVAEPQKLLALFDGRPALAPHHEKLSALAAPLAKLGQTLLAACIEAAPAHMRDGGLIRDGFDGQLDESRTLQRDSGRFMAEYQQRLVAESGIGSLKIGYNKVFGYYIEVTHLHIAKIPPTFTRKQTLKNAERYITPTLKEFEDKVLGAEAKAIDREQQLFDKLCADARALLPELHAYSELIAELDVLAGFARRAVRYRYIRPVMVPEPVLHVVDGRHPVLDELLADRFVPNDIALGSPLNPQPPTPIPSLSLITGPNMAGKSTYIRTAALLTLLAHTGSFIPATSATVGLTDRIFTRIGASDEIHLGQSTFMVEMTETANICHHATAQSLVILDEIGRGTSTLDGLALAWAITEHLARRGCRTLFATHYHELTQLAEQFSSIANLSVTVREWADQIVFLHRIAPGAADKSYGIHVAQIAGLPAEVTARARDLMTQLEVLTTSPRLAPGPAAKPAAKSPQLSLFTEYVEHPAMKALRETDVNNLTPMMAFDLLRRLREEANNGHG